MGNVGEGCEKSERCVRLKRLNTKNMGKKTESLNLPYDVRALALLLPQTEGEIFYLQFYTDPRQRTA